ncbi:polyprenyl synthetase family protein [Planomonospora venezuelensis]|uniref:Geranylgeranyl diphosphate synthase type I n=1 Tax=Planomonospora venezuelensis TaxID=1999 RepID=A0A841DB26_PLAVE|nr:polyprenyl synthetase family protein [Planomonospora venezuelensis]MBB5967220.1 geranylgeranyl diphosphate synthase type I [Planomonospora venezuelensis]GIN02991.1 dimethylallyltransferase [Planomonospora venezuelensis]
MVTSHDRAIGSLVNAQTRAGAAAGRTADDILAAARAMTEPAHQAAVERLPEEIRHVAGYHAGWWDADGRPCAGTGKAVRPALVLACARAIAEGAGWPGRAGPAAGAVRAAVPAAVAVELVHDFSLLHDDVMDGDPVRRHRPAAWTVFGTGSAVLAGDTLISLALDVLADSGAQTKVLTTALLRLCGGQNADLAFERRTDITLAECVTMAADKTGALLGCACELGALAGGADPARAARLREFGEHLGLAFQLVDDLLGIWGDPETTGKPVYGDLVARKKSLPVVAALTSQTPAGERLARLYGRNTLDEQALAQAAQLIDASGARLWATEQARHHMEAALEHLERAEPAPDAAADLRVLAHLIVHRDR